MANFSDIRYSSFSSENASALVREYFQFVKNSLYEVEIVVQDKADILDYLPAALTIMISIMTLVFGGKFFRLLRVGLRPRKQ